MAVVQISRIQVRRGRSQSETGLPQLASGEIAWALDTQELFIGNGSVAEGAPAVGNTKILTERDLTVQGSILNLIQYIYGDPSIVTTGPSPNSPVSRYLQDRLDDRVSIRDFGALGDGVTDDTAAIQRAIDQLFLNPSSTSSTETPDGVKTRVILEFQAGTYLTKKTLYIPSYSTIVGTGLDKTILQYEPISTITGGTTNDSTTVITTGALSSMIGATVTGTNIPANTTITGAVPGVSLTLNNAATATGTSITFTVTQAGPAIQFINDTSTIDNPSVIGSTQSNTQPRNINISNLTVYANTDDRVNLQLDAVKDSKFENLNIKGSWASTYNKNSIGIALNAVSSLVTCERNIFKNIHISGFSYGVCSRYDILDNEFNGGLITDVKHGIILGSSDKIGVGTLADADGSSVGEWYGSRNTIVSNIQFNDVKYYAVYVGLGSGNSVQDCKFINVGNNGGGHSEAEFPQVYFDTYSNTYRNNYSDRSETFAKLLPTVSLVLSSNITASKGVLVTQAVTGSQGALLNDVTNDNVIVVVSTDTFNTTNNLTINGDATPSVSNTAVHPTTAQPVVYSVYVPELGGYGTYESFGARSASTLSGSMSAGTFNLAFRLPVSVSKGGEPTRSISYEIDYLFRTSTPNFSRQGTLTVIVDVDSSSPSSVAKVQLSDEYNYTGTDADPLNPDSTKLSFRAALTNIDGNYVGNDELPYTIQIEYNNLGETGIMSYSYSASF